MLGPPDFAENRFRPSRIFGVYFSLMELARLRISGCCPGLGVVAPLNAM